MLQGKLMCWVIGIPFSNHFLLSSAMVLWNFLMNLNSVFEKHWVSQVLMNFPTTKSQAQLFLSKTVARYTKQINQAQLKYELKQLYWKKLKYYLL